MATLTEEMVEAPMSEKTTQALLDMIGMRTRRSPGSLVVVFDSASRSDAIERRAALDQGHGEGFGVLDLVFPAAMVRVLKVATKSLLGLALPLFVVYFTVTALVPFLDKNTVNSSTFCPPLPSVVFTAGKILPYATPSLRVTLLHKRVALRQVGHPLQFCGL